jgi:hypothetical protein
MKRIAVAVGLVLVCGSAFGQRPDNPGRRGDHRPTPAGNSSGTGANQALGGTRVADQGSAARGNGLSRIGDRANLGAGSTNAAPSGMPPTARGNSFDHRHDATQREQGRTHQTTGTPEAGAGGRGRSAQAHEHLTGHQRALQVQLAAVDRMRDKALESGNQEMLAKADELEQRIRERFAGVTLPEIQPMSPDPTPGPTSRGRGNPLRDSANQGPGGQGDFGQGISQQARADGRGFGQWTSQQARELGREFGKSNADKSRVLTPPAPIDPPVVSPVDPPVAPPIDPVPAPGGSIQ